MKAEVIGKPTAEFFKAALGNVSPEEAIMIGDVKIIFHKVNQYFNF